MDIRSKSRLAQCFYVPAVGIVLIAVAACGGGGGGVGSPSTLIVDPDTDRYLQRVTDIGNAGDGGGVPYMEAPEVIAAGQLYCEVKGEYTDQHWSAGYRAGLQAVSQEYDLHGLQLDTVTQAATEVWCPDQ